MHPCTTTGSAPAPRPNILYVFTDEQSATALSCTGNKDIATPCLDRLAAAGTRFERAYCACPVCTPSRASMLSGLMPHKHGVIQNDTRLSPDHARGCIEHVLGAHDYECAYAGKWHIGPYKGLEAADLTQHPYRLLSAWDGHDPGSTVTDACTRFLAEKHDRPFFLIASYDTPHEICYWRDGGRGIQPESLEVCPQLPHNFTRQENEPSVLWEVYMDRHKHCREMDGNAWRRYRWAYYRYIERVDRDIGRLLDALDENGLEDNTLVIFSSDHGDGMGAHQWLQKCCHYDEVTRVPFIMRFPGHVRPGQVDHRLVSAGIDFFPTVLDYAGIECPADRDGVSLRLDSPLAGRPRDEVVSEIWVAGPDGSWADNPFGRMVRTERYKYVVYDRGRNREQLFDLDCDPLEMRSLVGDATSTGILAEHRQRLSKWCRETGDAVGIAMLNGITD